LTPAIDYRFTVLLDDEFVFLDASDSHPFRALGTTFENYDTENALDFKIGFACCSKTASDAGVFKYIINNEDLKLFFHNGNMFDFFEMEEDQEKTEEDYNDKFASAIGAKNQRQLYTNFPVVYSWDQYDYGGLNSENPSRTAARRAYRKNVPHYPLIKDEDEDGAIFHAFSYSRVRFIVLDVRSERIPVADDNEETRNILGEEQMRWLFDELMLSSELYSMIVIVNPVTWIADGDSGWGPFELNRQNISNFITENEFQEKNYIDWRWK